MTQQHTDAADSIASLIYRGISDIQHAQLCNLFTQAAFQPDHRIDPQRDCQRAYERLAVLNHTVGPASRLLSDDRFFIKVHEWVALHDHSLFVLLALHYNLCLGTLTDYDPPDPGVRQMMADLDGMRAVGEYLMTELGYGNNSQALQTRATYDPSRQEFVIDTPSPAATKFMPPTTAAGIPKIGIVLARLISLGTDHGIHPFVVALSTADTLAPGIESHPLGNRPVNHADHALTSFRNVRVPRAHLLTGPGTSLALDGSYQSSITDAHQRYLQAGRRLHFARLAITAGAVACCQAAIQTVIRYSRHRATFAPQHLDVPVLSYRTYYRPLIIDLARTYAMTALLDYAQTASAGPSADAQHIITVTKAVCTQWAERIIAGCRARCGAQGMFSTNRIIDYLIFAHSAVTAEGDSPVIIVKAAGDLLAGATGQPTPAAPPPGGNLLDEDLWRYLMRQREFLAYSDTYTILHAHGGQFFDAWNAAGPQAVHLIEAQAARMALESLLAASQEVTHPLAARALRRMAAVFALDEIQRDAAWFAGHQLLTPAQLHKIGGQHDELTSAALSDVDVLTGAFRFPDSILAAPIATSHGDYTMLLASLLR